MKRIGAMALAVALLAALCAVALLAALCAGALAEGKVETVGELNANTWSEENLSILVSGLNDTTFRITYYDDLSAMMLALRAGHIDWAYLPLASSQYAAARSDDLEIVTEDRTVAFSMAAPKDNQPLLDALNEAIRSMLDDGTMAELEKTYITDLAADGEIAKAAIQPIEGAETIRVYVTGDQPPLDYVSADGEPAGFNVAMIAEIGKRANLNVELVTGSAGARVSMITSGRVDCLFWMRYWYYCNDAGERVSTGNEIPEFLEFTNTYLESQVSRIRVK